MDDPPRGRDPAAALEEDPVANINNKILLAAGRSAAHAIAGQILVGFGGAGRHQKRQRTGRGERGKTGFELETHYGTPLMPLRAMGFRDLAPSG